MNVVPRKWLRSASVRPIKDQHEEGRQFQGRATTAFIIIAAARFLLVLRFVYLQVFSFQEFATRSASNQVRIVPVAPNRGLI